MHKLNVLLGMGNRIPGPKYCIGRVSQEGLNHRGKLPGGGLGS